MSKKARQALEFLKKQTFQNKTRKGIQLGSAIKLQIRIDIVSLEMYADI